MKILNLKLLRGVGLTILAASLSPAPAQSNGAMVLQNLTTPRGGVWLNGGQGGHFWVADGGGVCRVNAAGNGFQTGSCNGTAKSAGEIVTGVSPAGTTYLFVPDYSTKSTSVVRLQFSPANESLGGALTMNVSINGTVDGGGAGARPVAAALSPTGDLYVGFLKTGSIMKIAGALTTTSGAPPVSRVAATSDGRGVNALLFVGNDLYVAESGGAGLSLIIDPSGRTRTPCSAAALCTAAPINPPFAFFPGGLATDGVSIYVAESPVTGTARILKYNPALPAGPTNPVLYSVNVPAYVSGFDGKTRTQYVGVGGLAVAPNGDLYVADDPTFFLPTATAGQGHLWRVPLPAAPPTIQSFAPASGPEAGGTDVAIVGSGFSIAANAVKVSFGGIPATAVTCPTVTQCTARTPVMPGGGVVDILVTVGTQSASASGFTFIANAPGTSAPVVSSISPNAGVPAGGTKVTVQGMDLFVAGQVTAVSFGTAGPGTVLNCAAVAPASATVNSQCVVASPRGTGVVDLQMSVNGRISAAGAASRYTYQNPTATLFTWGLTAPDGGLVFLPGNLGGHIWSSDHAQGFCRLDPLTARPAGPATPASPGSQTLHAMNLRVCDQGTLASAGQAAYDPRINGPLVNTANGQSIPAGTHYVYVADNSKDSSTVWRLTFDPNTETIVGAAEPLAPLVPPTSNAVKPNGVALGPQCDPGLPGYVCDLYVTNLTERYIRRIANASADIRTQTVSIVAMTGDGKGANGSISFLGNRLYIPENSAAAWFDVTACPSVAGPCVTTPTPLPTGAFVAGVATDRSRGYVYISDSPGGANATIWRHDTNNPAAAPIAYLTGGQLPASGSPEATVWTSQQAIRPWAARYAPGGTAGFQFAFGLLVDQRNGDLYVAGDPLAGARAESGSAFVAKLVQ